MYALSVYAACTACSSQNHPVNLKEVNLPVLNTSDRSL